MLRERTRNGLDAARKAGRVGDRHYRTPAEFAANCPMQMEINGCERDGS